MKYPAVYLCLLVLLAACTPKNAPRSTETPTPPDSPDQYDDMGKPVMGEESEDDVVDYQIMDAIDIVPDSDARPDSLPVYRASHTFEFDLIHTRIDISFDWENSRAPAKATLTLSPWFYTTDQLTLDAKGFDIHTIQLASGKELAYEYDGMQLFITLDKEYTREETLDLVIDYTAKPDERENIGGSSAITSDKGLYFINPKGEDSDKPQQIWTQGETEANSCWFPTIDKPNERCTQEMYITVEDRFVTLSNGLLINSKDNGDGTRTDYWKMDKPHAPYLFMMAIGEFAVVKEDWKDIELSYYVEPEYKEDAKDIFPYTPEMLDFFSEITGYPYPWQKYAQVVVRDYVSGAMENTTGVIFGEFVQMHKRELLDDHLTNEKIVAHEMFHHWFGDLVTTESWSNITLNEGFANYSEYLWMEHKYGRTAADEHLKSEQQGYFYSAQGGGHPLIDFGYESREDMFDAHSYNKGGCILHMLRNYLGDEAFFAGFNRYLKDNEFSDVEAHELRLAFEDVSGEDLNWFFNQWFFSTGHPVLEVEYGYDAENGLAFISLEQTQEGDDIPYIFNLPLDVVVYEADGTVTNSRIRMTKRQQVFELPLSVKPKYIGIDANRTLLAEVEDNHTAAEHRFIYDNSTIFFDRLDALFFLREQGDTEILMKALSDQSSTIRNIAINSIQPDNAIAASKIAALAENEQEPSVKSSAIEWLGSTENPEYVSIIKKGLGTTEAYSVVGASLQALMKVDEEAALSASRELKDEKNPGLVAALASMYAENPRPEFQDWFVDKSKTADYMTAFAMFESHQKFLAGLGDEAMLMSAVENWTSIATDADKNSGFRRFASAKAIFETSKYFKKAGNSEKATAVKDVFKKVVDQEEDETLKLYYGMLR